MSARFRFAEPATYPNVVKASGGWFAVRGKGELGSGPWRNDNAARAALEGNYEEAHRLNGKGKS